MTAATLLADLVARGVVLTAPGDGQLAVDAPIGRLTARDRAALIAHKAVILHLLRADPIGEPAAPCSLCGETAWGWEPAWHRAPHRRDDHDDHDDVEHHGAAHVVHDDHAVGEPEPVRGVCKTCIGRSVPTLATVAAGLTPAERAKLQAEADAGDRLAQTVLSELAVSGA